MHEVPQVCWGSMIPDAAAAGRRFPVPRSARLGSTPANAPAEAFALGMAASCALFCLLIRAGSTREATRETAAVGAIVL